MDHAVGHLCVRPDECGYNVWTTWGHGRPRQRERAYRQVYGQRWWHLPVTMAISLINWLACVFLRSCRRNECCAFRWLPRTGEDKSGSRRGVIFVYDGAPAHRNPSLKCSPPTVLSSTSTAVWKRRSRPTCRVQKLKDAWITEMRSEPVESHWGSFKDKKDSKLCTEAPTETSTAAKSAQWYHVLQTYLSRHLNRDYWRVN